MNCYTSPDELLNFEDGNQFMGTLPEMKNSTVRISGENNVLFCNVDVKLINSRINFNGSNSVVFLCGSGHECKLNLSIWNNSVFYIGEKNYINGTMNIVISEAGNIFIGSNGVYSFGIWIRNADPHLIYDIHTKKRINPTRSVFVGDHVWIGQQALILKGSMIASGSIVGAMSVVAGKKIPSNTSWAGNPVRELGKDIFWKGNSVHGWTQKQTVESMTCDEEDYIYHFDPSCHISFEEIDRKLSGELSMINKIRFLENLTAETNKNRFARNSDK